MTRDGREVRVFPVNGRWGGRMIVAAKTGVTVKESLARTYANRQAVRRAAKDKWPTLAKHVRTLPSRHHLTTLTT